MGWGFSEGWMIIGLNLYVLTGDTGAASVSVSAVGS